MKRTVIICAALLTCGLAATPSVWAEDSNKDAIEKPSKAFRKDSGFSPKEGFYIGVQYVNNFMDGDFDDSSYLVSSSAVYDIPLVDDGAGFGALIGGRFSGGAIELSYQRSTHDTSSSFSDMGVSEATYNVIECNLKFDLTRHRLRPYIQVGFGIPWLTVEKGAADEFSYFDETFIGFDVNVGAGLTYFLTERWALTGGVVYRWNWFSTVEGESIDESLLETTVNCTIGISYTF